MPRRLLGLLSLLLVGSVASADPPRDADVLAKANVPVLVCDALVVKNKTMNGLVLPLPGLGFVPLPVAVWECTVWHTPPRGPAGAPRVRASVRILTWAE